MKNKTQSKWAKRIARKQAKRARKYKRQQLASRHHGKPKFEGRNYHHLRNRCKGGTNATHNLLLIDIERHKAWHALFRNLDLSEAIDLLIRLEKAKARQS